MSLYREFRPRSLSEMTGQSSIIKTIKNQIETRNISHAYIFSGPRGIGKTSIAKILSRAVNCEHYDEFTAGNYHGEIPCNECQTCKDILADMSMDVIEMDAASNNGVDDIRAINDMVNFPPSSARYKVIIIDEVHMLSKSAFNALLKTLEEPPSYIIFILATTEVNRIPATVLSRCQRYDFKKMSEEELFERLEHVCKTLNKQYDEEALRLIATRSEGAMRDALSILDQCLSFSDSLTQESVLYSLSLVSESFLLKLFEALDASEFSTLLTLLKSANDNGFDPKLLLDDFSKFLYNLTRFVIDKKNPGFLEGTLQALNAQLPNLSVKKLVYFQQKVLFSSANIKTSTNVWIGLECLFLDMAAYRYENDTKALELRISELENKLQQVLGALRTDEQIAVRTREQLSVPTTAQLGAQTAAQTGAQTFVTKPQAPMSTDENRKSQEQQQEQEEAQKEAKIQDLTKAPQAAAYQDGTKNRTQTAIEQSVDHVVETKDLKEEILRLLLDGIPRRLPHLYLPIKQSSIVISDNILYIGIGNEYDFMVPTLNTTQNISEILKLLKDIKLTDIKFDYKSNLNLFQPSSLANTAKNTNKGLKSKSEEMTKAPNSSAKEEQQVKEEQQIKEIPLSKEEQANKVEQFFRKITENL